MGNYIEPFDFQTIFVNYFLGRAELFIFALIIVEAYVAAKLNLGNKVFLIILAISSILFASIIGQGIYFLILMIIGFITFKGISRLVS